MYNELNRSLYGRKPFNIASFERKVRRHEVTFSQIENGKDTDYLNSYLMEYSRSNGYIDFAERMVEKIDKRVYSELYSCCQKKIEKS